MSKKRLIISTALVLALGASSLVASADGYKNGEAKATCTSDAEALSAVGITEAPDYLMVSLTGDNGTYNYLVPTDGTSASIYDLPVDNYVIEVETPAFFDEEVTIQADNMTNCSLGSGGAFVVTDDSCTADLSFSFSADTHRGYEDSAQAVIVAE